MPKTSSEPAASCQRATLHGPTMATRWSVSVDCDATLDLEALRQDLAAAVEQVDAQMSPWKPESDLVRLNRAPVDAWVDLPPEILEVLACAMDIHRQSAGAFDPCVGALAVQAGRGVQHHMGHALGWLGDGIGVDVPALDGPHLRRAQLQPQL